MITELTILACFITGLISTLHCLGMCGGISTMLAIKDAGQLSHQTRFKRSLIYNFGRIFSYGLIGFLAGMLSHISVNKFFVQNGHFVLQLFSSFILIGIALHILGWFQGFKSLERLMINIWRPIQKIFKWLLPANNIWEIFCLGLIWGWLPCGLVYSVLLLAITSGDPIKSLFYMLAFGAGTLPGMVAASYGSNFLLSKIKQPVFRYLSATIILIIALITPFSSFFLNHHSHHHHHSILDGTEIPGRHIDHC